jgi:DNA-binding NarL/FixJ family response regulator
MKKINVTYVCAAAEEYPGCADLLYSYSEVNVVAWMTSLGQMACRMALANSDVLVLDESVLTRDGLQAVQLAHTNFPGLKILLVCEQEFHINMVQYLSIGVRGLIERGSCISLLRRAIPALYAGEVWIPRGLVQSLRKHTSVRHERLSWGVHPSMLPGRGRIN